VELALLASRVAQGGEVFVFKMPVATLAHLVAAAIDVVAPRVGRDPRGIATSAIEARPGEKPYEELMTAEESTRARDIGDMYAVLPAIEAHEDVIAAYRDAARPALGAYRSDGVEPMTAEAVRALVAEALSAPEGPA
jgi:FlaA1/EpsC-like NDP-sugar epimerase